MNCSRVIFVACLLASPAARAEYNAVLWDNDLFSPRKTDAYYTNGFIYHHVSDTQPPAQRRHWRACPGLDFLTELVAPALIPAGDDSGYWHSWEAGQVIQTPFNTQANPPDPQDEPYAGLLYVGCSWHVQTDDRAEALGLQFGVVGPLSLAEQSQNFVHRAIGVDTAKGWDRQLRNELVVNLSYDRQEVLRQMELGAHGLSVFDNTSLALGPLMTSAGAGINLLYAADPDAAFGLNPNYLGRYPRMSRRQPLGFYSLASLQFTGVLHNLFLNGNTWVHSPARVDHEPLVGSAQLLFGYGFSCWALQLGLNVSTRAFLRQEVEWPRYGTLGVTWGCSS